MSMWFPIRGAQGGGNDIVAAFAFSSGGDVDLRDTSEPIEDVFFQFASGGSVDLRDARQLLEAAFAFSSSGSVSLEIATDVVFLFTSGGQIDELISRPAYVAPRTQVYEFTSPADTGRDYSTARLLKGSVELPIKRFSISSSSDQLNERVAIQLARPDRSSIDQNASYKLELGYWDGTAYQYDTWADEATFASLSYQQNREGDTLEFTINTEVSERFELIPNAPLTLYRYETFLDDEFKEDVSNTVYSAGSPVLSMFRRMAGLTLYHALDAAYIDGCGFDNVHTNIPDYPISRVDFTVQSGFHGAISSLVGMYSPEYQIIGNDLYIITKFAPIPSALVPRVLNQSKIKNLGTTLERGKPIQAVELQFRLDSPSISLQYYTDRVINDPTIRPVPYGSPGYTELNFSRTVREYRDGDGGVVLRTDEIEVRREVAATIDGATRTVQRDTQQNRYDALGRKAGHTRTIEGLAPSFALAGALTLQTLMRETANVRYENVGGRSEQALTTILVEGLILVDSENTYLDKPYEIPATDGHQTAAYDLSSTGQTTRFGAIRSVFEQTIPRGNGQVDVVPVVINHLNGGTPEYQPAQARTGSAEVQRKAKGERVRKELIRAVGVTNLTHAPVPFNTGELPPSQARDLAYMYIESLNRPPDRIAVSPLQVDKSLDKGAVIVASGRDGVTKTFIIDGSEVTGERGEDGVTIGMNLTATEYQYDGWF